MDNASFHRSRGMEEEGGVEGGRGLTVGYLPRYSPHLNPMEGVWRQVKGFLMPRRHYEGGLRSLGRRWFRPSRPWGVMELKILGEGT